MLPIVIRTTEEMLRLVPDDLREASLALGASRARTILTVVLPAALPGITSGALLAVARAAGETAPLLFTIGVARKANCEPLRRRQHRAVDPDLPQRHAALPGRQDRAWGAALTLIALVLVLTILARLVTKRFAVPILSAGKPRQQAHIERSRGCSLVVIGRPYLRRYERHNDPSARPRAGAGFCRHRRRPCRGRRWLEPSPRGPSAPRCPSCCTTPPAETLAATLLGEIAVDAARSGIRRFVNESLPDDAPVRRVFRNAGFETATVYQQGVLRSSFAIGSWPLRCRRLARCSPSASRSGSRDPGWW